MLSLKGQTQSSNKYQVALKQFYESQLAYVYFEEEEFGYCFPTDLSWEDYESCEDDTGYPNCGYDTVGKILNTLLIGNLSEKSGVTEIQDPE